MYPLETKYIHQPTFVKLWTLLAFQAGFVNSFGFLSCGRYVSHVTGYGTQAGLAIGHNSTKIALEMLAGILTFIGGSAASSMFTAVAIDRGRKPSISVIIFFLPLCYLAMSLLGAFGYFGKFGEEILTWRDFELLLTISFACGLQNGCFASMTAGQIRTTHLTGLSTDLGTDFARIFVGRPNAPVLSTLKAANRTRLFILFSFVVGAVCSVLFSDLLEYLSLLIPAASSLAILCVVRYRIVPLINRDLKI